MCKHIMSFEKKEGVMKMYKCIVTEMLAEKKTKNTLSNVGSNC